MSRGRRADRSLACFVEALQGLRLVVELRTDTIVRGLLESTDDRMNLTLSDVVYEPLEGTKQTMDFLYLRARHVRYIHLPTCVDPGVAVEAHRRRVRDVVKAHNKDVAANAVKLVKGVQAEGVPGAT